MKYVQQWYTHKKMAILALSAIAIMLSLNYSTGPGAGFAGSRVGASFSSGSCNSSGCHSTAGTFSPTLSMQLLSGSTAVTTYTPGNTYTLRITISSSGTTSNTRYGFQTVAVQTTSNTAVNSWGTLPSGTQSVSITGRTHVEHSSKSSSNTFDIPWTAPSTANYSITFYGAGLVANNNSLSSGDNMASTSLTVTPPCSTPTISANVTNVLCFGQSTGAVNLSLSGGTTPFTYSWTGPGGFTSTSQNISGRPAGTYKVVITANGGCKDSTTVTITQPTTAVTGTASINSPICVGDALMLMSTGSGGTGGLTYSWSGPGGYSSNNQNSTIPNAAFSQNGVFTVTIRDANNCTTQKTVTAVIDSAARVDSFTSLASPYTTLTFTPVNRRNTDSTLWLFGDGATDTASTPTHTYADGTYTVMLIVKNRCGSDTFTKNIIIEPVSVQSIIGIANFVSVYPNPATGKLYVEGVNNTNIYSVSMMNITGQNVFSTYLANKKLTMDISKLPKGLYFLSIETSAGMVYKKIEILE